MGLSRLALGSLLLAGLLLPFAQETLKKEKEKRIDTLNSHDFPFVLFSKDSMGTHRTGGEARCCFLLERTG